jgi:mycothiol synthase
MTELSWRPIERADVPAWASMLAAVADAAHSSERSGERDLITLFDYPDCDFPAGSIAAWDGDVMVACGLLMTRSSADPVHEMRLDGEVHPAYRRRGIGGQVLDWAETAAIPLHEQRHPGRPLSLRGWAKAGDPGTDALFAARGYRVVRWWHTMRMDLSKLGPEKPLPEGVRVVGFSLEVSEAAREVRNEAFRDHWGSTDSTAETWEHYRRMESFRPEFSYLAYADGQPAGVLLSSESAETTRATGVRDLYIGIVGTRRAGRNRGIATALLSRALTDGKAAGYGTSSLLVDADSLTGAVGINERVGYVVDETKVTQAKELIPAA